MKNWKVYAAVSKWWDELFFGISICYSVALNDTYNITLHLGYWAFELGIKRGVTND
jgi:hypothetical protein